MKPVPYDSGSLSGLSLERTPTGYVQTPLWTYDCRDEIVAGRFQYLIGGRFHQIKEHAMAAFLSVLNDGKTYGLWSRTSVLCHEQPPNADGEVFWRLRTSRPCELPKPKTIALNRPQEAKETLPCIDL